LITKILFVFGTRPEAIKMAPLIRTLKSDTDHFDVKVCVTAQHREMLDLVLDFFDIRPDFDLNLMIPNQTLFDITVKALAGLEKVFEEVDPDNVIVQGDTTSTFVGTLAGYYTRTKVSHLEAGLRSGDKFSPYPEECNRLLTSRLADFHFAPTEKSRQALAAESIKDNVWVVGNTVIDALFQGLDIIQNSDEQPFYDFFRFLDFGKRIILVTAHRRESFGKPLEGIANALRDLALNFTDIELVYPVHLNPNVRVPINRILGGIENVHLIEPLNYSKLIWLLNRSHLVLTDSGGIQEEAPSLGKPVLVMRDVTERTEGIEAGTAKLVGTNQKVIIEETTELLTNHAAYEAMAQAVNPYGDGGTSRLVQRILIDHH